MPNEMKYTSKNPLMRLVLKRFFRKAKAQLEAKPYSSLADFGCGEGYALKILEPRCKDVAGFDISDEALVKAREVFPGATYTKIDVNEGLPFKNDRFDALICLEVIEHLPDPQKAIDEIARISKSAVISTPYSLVFRTLNLLRLKNIPRLGEDPEHIQRFSPRTFRKLLESRYRNVRITYAMPWLIARVER